MLIFEMLDKAKADTLLPPLFRILYDNMDEIAPTGEGFDADFNEWFGAVRPAIEKPQRNIIRQIYDRAYLNASRRFQFVPGYRRTPCYAHHFRIDTEI